jgi:hypothetical protein
MVSCNVHLNRVGILILLGLFSSCADRFNPRKEIITTCKQGTEPVRKVLFSKSRLIASIYYQLCFTGLELVQEIFQI